MTTDSFSAIEWLPVAAGDYSFFVFIESFLLLLSGELLPLSELHERHPLSFVALSLDCDYIILHVPIQVNWKVA